MGETTWTPQVGDKVRVIKDDPSWFGAGGEVTLYDTEYGRYWVKFPTIEHHFRADELERVQPSATPDSGAVGAALSTGAMHDLAASYRKAKAEREQGEQLSSAHEAFFAAEFIAALEARHAAQQARVGELEAALRELYDATAHIESGVAVATEDWHHDLFTARGVAYLALSKAAALGTADGEGEG